MNEIDVGVDFGITNSDIAINSDGSLSYKSFRSEKNIHLSFNNIIKDLKRNSVIKSICVTGGKHLDLPENFDGLKVLKKNEISCIGAGAKYLSGLDSNFLVLSCGSGTACVGFKNEISTHLGGSGLGGGTIRGLCKLSAQVETDARDYFKEKVYQTVVPRNVRLSEAPSHGVPVLIYDKQCSGSKSYIKFTEEFLAQESSFVSAA